MACPADVTVVGQAQPITGEVDQDIDQVRGHAQVEAGPLRLGHDMRPDPDTLALPVLIEDVERRLVGCAHFNREVPDADRY
jgi:hypothetical protein